MQVDFLLNTQLPTQHNQRQLGASPWQRELYSGCGQRGIDGTAPTTSLQMIMLSTVIPSGMLKVSRLDDDDDASENHTAPFNSFRFFVCRMRAPKIPSNLLATVLINRALIDCKIPLASFDETSAARPCRVACSQCNRVCPLCGLQRLRPYDAQARSQAHWLSIVKEAPAPAPAPACQSWLHS